MKKLTTIFGAFLIASVVLISCGPSSEKGNWNESDMNNCISEMDQEMKSDQDAMDGLEMFGIDLDSYSKCVCETFEEGYDSYASANIAAEEMTEEESFLLLSPCFGEDFMDLMNSID
jgi:hypothetical protein